MVPLAIVGRAVATGVGEGVGVGPGPSGSSADGTGVGDGDFFGDAAGDAFVFFFGDGLGDLFTFFFFFEGVGVFLAVAFFSSATLWASASVIWPGSVKLSRRFQDFPQWKPARQRALRRETMQSTNTNKDDSPVRTSQKKSQAGCGAGAAFCNSRSCSRRRIAFSFPPSNSNKQVRYIQVSKMMMEARA